MSAITDHSAVEIGELVAGGELSAEETCRAFLDRAEATEPTLHAFLSLDAERVIDDARAVDRRLAAGEGATALTGVPVAVKDNLCTAGVATTAGSRFLEGYVPPHDATVVRRLREAGAIVFGKTNCDEFGMGSSTENSAYAVTANPWKTDRVPGGSSGGSAAAVAARAVPAALGSDTGGSIRQPAAFCGVVGVKPTYGRVSRHGLVAFASSLDQVGPFARDVADAGAVLSVIAGHDPLDSTSADDETARFGTCDAPARFRFGVPDALLESGTGLASDVGLAFEEALTQLGEVGGERVQVELPNHAAAVATYQVVATAEASSNLARYDGVGYGRRAAGATTPRELVERSRGEGLGPEVKRRILLGTHVLSAGYHDAYYRRANRVRWLIARDFERAFDRCDVVAMPTTPTTAFALGEKVADPLAMYLSDVFTVPLNLAGLPGVSLPCGLGEDGLPVGLQLIAGRWQDGRLLAIADRLEDALAFRTRHAPPT